MYYSKQINIIHLSYDKEYEKFMSISKKVSSDKTLADIYNEVNEAKKTCNDVIIKVVNEQEEVFSIENLKDFNEIMLVLSKNIKRIEKTTMITTNAVLDENGIEKKVDNKKVYENIVNYINFKVII